MSKSKLKFTNIKELNNNSTTVGQGQSHSLLLTNRKNIPDTEIINLVLKSLPEYKRIRGNGSKAEFINKKYPFISVSRAKKILVVIENATNRELENIKEGKISISKIYKKALNNKTGKRVEQEFEDKINVLIKYDKDGYFYYKYKKSNKTLKLFKLPLCFNKDEIKEAILKAIKENI